MVLTRGLGNHTLDEEALKTDKKTCLRVGPCGIGKKAVYLNSFYIDRMYYIPYEDIQRVFKRVAMSKGGFTGKGVFSSMPYLVVQYNNGAEKQCNFKYEDEVDLFLEQFAIDHPDIPLHSEESERKLKEAEAEERKKYIENLSPKAQKTIDTLEEAYDLLRARPGLYTQLAAASKRRRTIDNADPTYRIVAIIIFLISVGAAMVGGILMIQGVRGYPVYLMLFGLAFMFLMMSSRVLPTRSNNRQLVQQELDEAVHAMEGYLGKGRQFPLPAHYAHPVCLDRMIRSIRMGRAESSKEAYQLLKDDLKALNNTVKVTQKEYDEVVAIKPMFLVNNYEDTYGSHDNGTGR